MTHVKCKGIHDWFIRRMCFLQHSTSIHPSPTLLAQILMYPNFKPIDLTTVLYNDDFPNGDWNGLNAQFKYSNHHHQQQRTITIKLKSQTTTIISYNGRVFYITVLTPFH